MSSTTLSTSCPAGKETLYRLRSIATTRRISVRASVLPTHCLWPVLTLAANQMSTGLGIYRTLVSPHYIPTPKGAKALLSMINSGRLVQRSGIKDVGSSKAVSTTHQVFVSVKVPPYGKGNAQGIKNYSHLMMLYFGAATLAFPGIQVSSIQRPCSDVSRFPPVIAAGHRRIVSFMTASKCGSVARLLASVTSQVANSL